MRGGFFWMDFCPPERFARVNVSNSRNNFRDHQYLFYFTLFIFEPFLKFLEGKIFFQSFRSHPMNSFEPNNSSVFHSSTLANFLKSDKAIISPSSKNKRK